MQYVFLVLVGIYGGYYLITEIPELIAGMRMNENTFNLIKLQSFLQGRVINATVSEVKRKAALIWLTRLFARVVVCTVIVYLILRFV
jgi:hypothetical protein